MAIVKGAAIESFLRKPPADAVAVLFYGPDSGGVRERAAQLVRSVAGSLDDPFSVVRLDDSTLASDPGRLADEFKAISMFGGRRAVCVSGADKAFHRAVEPLLSAPSGALIVAEAGNLAKSSPLRSLFEKSPVAFAIASYEASEYDLRGIVAEELAATGASIEPDAERLLVSLLAGDRLLSRSEIAKLALYGMGGPPLTVADVETLCGNVSAQSMDDVIDAVFEGELAACDLAISRLSAAGTPLAAVLSVTALHIARLQHLRLEIDRGKSPEEAIRNARPPIFFKKIDGMLRQLRIWDMQGLLAAASSLAQATQATRSGSSLEVAIVSRALLALARNARQKRLDRY